MTTTVAKHDIQKYILSRLANVGEARFRDLKPPKVATNLYSYHLAQLLRNGLVKKTDGGYTLDVAGLIYSDRQSAEKLLVRSQPKIITMLVIQNSDGDVLLQRRSKQPYIDTWTLPHGKIHTDDTSLLQAAMREAVEKLNVHNQDMTHVGDCYIRVNHEGAVMTVTLAHIFAFNRDDIEITSQLQWVQPHKLHQCNLAPAVDMVIARTFFRDPFFFEEFEVSW